MDSKEVIERAQQHISSRSFEEAQKSLQEVLADPSVHTGIRKRVFHLLGTAFYLQGNVGRSIESFKAALKIDPKYTDAAISLSVVYNDIGKYDEAKNVYKIANQSLKLKSPGSDEHVDRQFCIKHLETGDLYLKFHRFDEALGEYSKALQLDTNRLEIRIKIAKVYAKKGFTTRAVQELQQLCNEHYDYMPARIQLGLMHFSTGNIIDAQLEWEKVLQRSPDNSEVKTYLQMSRQATETSV
jgi:Tfp pilus assembly protein PilF